MSRPRAGAALSRPGESGDHDWLRPTLAVDVPLPEGVTVRRVTEEADVRAMSAMQEEVFGDPASGQMANDLLRRLSLGDGMEL